MSVGLANDRRLEGQLATILSLGTWLASAVIGVGLLTPGPHRTGMTIVDVGVAILILLPILRVALMLAAFSRARERLLAIVAGLVLAIIALGVLSGLRQGSVHAPANRHDQSPSLDKGPVRPAIAAVRPARETCQEARRLGPIEEAEPIHPNLPWTAQA